MSYFFVLLTGVTESFVTFVLFARHGQSARLATPLTYANRFPIRCAQLVVREIHGVSKVPMTVVAGDSNLRECARRTDHEIPTRPVADLRDVAFTSLAASFTLVLFRHGTGKIRYDMIMSFDLVVKYIESFRGVYLSFEHYIFTAQNSVVDYLILPKVFVESDQFGDPRPVGQIDTGSLE